MELEGLGILNMDSGLMLSVADLRSQAIVDWEQDVHLSFQYKRAAPMKIKVEPELVVPKAVFKYELHQALVEGTSRERAPIRHQHQPDSNIHRGTH